MTLGAALVLLNASLTFQSVWPTPAIRWRGTLSIELADGFGAPLSALRDSEPAASNARTASPKPTAVPVELAMVGENMG